ncbi:MAG: acyltransferase family protein [Bacilli bacterium]|nr:acyltransferase family protein [Bacilli bacterium]
MKKIERNSNHELMRIISMFLIVLGHSILFGNALKNSQNESVTMILMIWEFILLVHVNSFALLTGYYQSNSTFKQSALWKIINQTLFYKALILIILTALGLISLGKVEILKELFPINMTQYWFIKVYFLLYCLSPFLNKFINVLNKKDFKRLLIVGFILFSIIPAITNYGAFSNNGYTLYNFIYLYFVGAYLRIYPLDKSYLFKRLSKNAYQLSLIVIFITSVALRFILYYFADRIAGTNSILDEIAITITHGMDHYSRPLLMIQSIAYFSWFTSITIKSKIINKISPLVLGVYIIHINMYLREFLFKWVGVDRGPTYSYRLLIDVLLGTIIIFIACLVIEYIRQVIFKFIYKRKISKKIRDSYYNLLHNIYIKD